MSLPDGFLNFIRRYSSLLVLEHGLLETAPVSIRLNPCKPACISHLTADGTVDWCKQGLYLRERPVFTLDPLFHQGCYYVQDASSMAIYAVLSHIAPPDRPIRYLDACAAPGGKTTAALSALPHGSVIVANEYDFRRAEILTENVIKWGYPDVVVTRGDTNRFSSMSGTFDIIAVDAPCSGEGMMRKDTQAVAQWSEGLICECADTQRHIIHNLWPALRPGGHLIYSTCTFNLTENEDILHHIINEYDAIPVSIPLLDSIPEITRGIGTDLPCYRFLPGRTRGEGLFIAIVQKPGSATPAAVPSAKKQQPAPAGIGHWFTGKWRFITEGSSIHALPASNADFMQHVARKAGGVLACGCEAATIKGHDIIPAHALAMLAPQHRSPDAFITADVDLDTALAYLRRDTIVLPGLPRGFIMLQYMSMPLGFVKNIGNRSNNLYPKNWRIQNL